MNYHIIDKRESKMSNMKLQKNIIDAKNNE